MGLSPQNVHDKKAIITSAGQFFEIEERKIDGRTVKAYRHAPANLVDMLQAARNHGDQDFLVYQAQRYTYAEFFREADALAHQLQVRFEVRPGDRVALAMRNNPQWCISFIAATLIGAVVVPINSWGKTEELHYALQDSQANLLICDLPRYKLISEALEDGPTIIVCGESEDGTHGFDECIKAGLNQDFNLVNPDSQDTCLILYTSGSTGFPKGVVHRHVAVCQSLMNMMWLGYLLIEIEGVREYRGGATRETPLLTIPLFHATGLLSGLLLPLQTAQKVVMMHKWDSDQAISLIEQERVTSLSTVPAIVQDLLANPKFDEADTRSLIRVTGAGAATPAGLPELIRRKCANPSRSAGWGMTETMAVGTTMSGAIYDLRPDAAGIQSPIIEMRFVDERGEAVSTREPGELEVRGITCSPGYWNKPDANAQTFREDGWMVTGDIAMFSEDGYLHVTGRKKEIVIRGGENIYPGEVEQVAYRLNAVQECVVFGVPDSAMGEEMVMVVYAPASAELTAQRLRMHLGTHLADYKVPKDIVVVDQPLPKNASEKLHKLNVRERYLEKKLGT